MLRGPFKKLAVAMMTAITSIVVTPTTSRADDFHSAWHEENQTLDQVWVGDSYWANRLQDWKIKNQRLECIETRILPYRTVHLLSHQLSGVNAAFEVSVDTDQLTADKVDPKGEVGILVGAGQGKLDHRGAAIIHQYTGEGFGILLSINTQGQVAIKDMNQHGKILASGEINGQLAEVYTINAKFSPVGNGKTRVLLTAKPHDPNKTSLRILTDIDSNLLTGNIALVSHPGTARGRNAKGKKFNAARYAFSNWRGDGDRIVENQKGKIGAILSSQYTLSNRILKITAQMMPVAKSQPERVLLQVLKDDKWVTIQESQIMRPSLTAPFRVTDWDDTKATPYRLLYMTQNIQGKKIHTWGGTIGADPKDKDVLTVAGFTGNHNNSHYIGMGWGAQRKMNNKAHSNWVTGMWFPHKDMTDKVKIHKPDVLFFSGDQVYEGASPSFADRSKLLQDYMYKWYLWCWAYRDMTKDLPCVTLPDDHDVYQGNIWGQGGRKAPRGQNSGGYVHSAEFVKMVDRTQTSHLPDPFDPTPVEQGINVYYTNMNYGNVGFAIIEDRKFKNGCANQGLPSSKTNRPDHYNNPDFDTKGLDLPGLKLLGDRQLKFLNHWAGDWQGHKMKMALSQTIFGNMATHHGPGLNFIIADLDSNGWPQTGRNKAVSALRKGFAFHLAGDQHLATIVNHGVEKHRDSIWSFCVPSIANFYPRKWHPKVDGKNRLAGSPSWMGDHLDGFQNKVSVYAAANPGQSSGRLPADLHDKMAGYGIVKMNKKDRTITMECWPRYAVPGVDKQYAGWPKTINQTDNFNPEAKGYLPEFTVQGVSDPVFKIFDNKSDELVYALRINGQKFQPWVQAAGTYRVEISHGKKKAEYVIDSKTDRMQGRKYIVELK